MYSKKQESYGVSYQNENGPKIGSADDHVLVQDGLVFRNLANTEELYPYEDWRLSPKERAKDLAARLPVEAIAGLMMYSPHQMVPAMPGGPFAATYDGKTFPESGKESWALSDQQKSFLENDQVRHVLVLNLADVETAVNWNNQMQAFAERQPFGIPINFSSDPRHGAGNGAEFKGSGCQVSRWPDGLGLGATFSKEVCEEFGEAVSKEYRALGIATALSPQVDLGTEPRWMRVEDTYGIHPDMTADMGRAYCDGMQTTEGSPDGWGTESVCTMAKHWPGGGPCEGGRDAHYPFGKFAVYPGGSLDKHLTPFLEGAFKLDGPTKQTASVMPYYTVSWGVDQADGKNVGNSYSHYIIHDLLREKYGFDGVVCTDWGITQDPADKIDSFGSRCYGVEQLTEAERHLLALENGVDQFGGNSDQKPILEAYRLGCEKHGKAWMRKRMEESAVRLLTNMFRCGLFENPYLDLEESREIIGCEELCKKGYEAQLRSVVMLKNTGVLPISSRKKVYIPKRHIAARKAFFRTEMAAEDVDPMRAEALEPYFDRTEDAAEADFALVFIESPLSDGYSQADADQGGNGYVPITLQYRPYHAEYARKHSIAGGDFRESFTDRNYYQKDNTAANEADLDLVLDTKKKMGDKPMIVCIRMHHPTVLAELEACADAILVDFGVESRAILDLVSGKAQPSGLLPVQLPKDMRTVEEHCEDTPFDMEPYRDACGNAYDFGFGMNWSGVIQDARTKKYTK
ncbi:MAG: glycoside hydrolase family 3 N-terminal domain-containing protein [Eubacteriales bacterium]|nr:glycoside hydrolase family 3 N-terminal domain-containing protein [Eubacteriales bacterium]